MKKKLLSLLGLTSIIILTVIVPVTTALAQTVPNCPSGTYCALSTIPGVTETGKPADPSFIVTNIYGISIGIAAILAVGMIIWAGIQYATTEAISGKSEAKKHWQGAVFGLLLLLGSYLILRTINVDLVNQDLSLGDPIGCTDTLNGNRVPCGTVAYENDLKATLASLAAKKAAENKALEDSNAAIAAKEQVLNQALADNKTDAELEKIEKELAQLKNDRNVAQNNLLRTTSYTAIVSTATQGIAQFGEAQKNSKPQELKEAGMAFITEGTNRLAAATNLKNSSGANVFSTADIDRMRSEYQIQIDYMNKYIAWAEGRRPISEKPVRPPFNLAPTQ